MVTQLTDTPVSAAPFGHLRAEPATSGVDFLVAVIAAPAFAIILVKGSALAQLRLAVAQTLAVLSLLGLLLAIDGGGLLLLFAARGKEAFGARFTLHGGRIALDHLGLAEQANRVHVGT